MSPKRRRSKSKKRKNPYWEDDPIFSGLYKRRKLRKDEYYDPIEGRVRRKKKGNSLFDLF